MRWGSPLPIPNRVVKPTCADGTTKVGEYVVANLYLTLKVAFRVFFCPFLSFFSNFAPVMNKILLIQTASLGDVILATAAAASLRNLFPNAHIAMLVKKECASAILNNPCVDQLFEWDKKYNKYRNLISLIRIIRRQSFDVAISFHRFASSGFIVARSGAKIKAGFSQNPLSFLFNRKVPHVLDGAHETERNLNLLNACFPNILPAKPVLASVSLPPDISETFTEKPFVTIFPGSLWETKRLPLKVWTDMIGLIPEHINVAIMGSEKDSVAAQQLQDLTQKKLVNLCGKCNILESAAVMKMAMMNFTNDSAPTHLASAVDAPVTTVFCSTVPRFGFGPLSTSSRMVEIHEPLMCRPCGIHGHRSCPLKHFRCGNDIKAEQLWNDIVC